MFKYLPLILQKSLMYSGNFIILIKFVNMLILPSTNICQLHYLRIFVLNNRFKS